MEGENKLLRRQLEEMRSELTYWKTKAIDASPNEACTDFVTPRKETGLWGHTIMGLRQFVTPTQSGNPNQRQIFGGESSPFTARAETGLHHRKLSSTNCSEKLRTSPLKVCEESGSPGVAYTVSTDGEGGILFIKLHSSDREEDYSIVSREEVEPSFCHSLIDRGAWLVGLLVLQSFSSFIIQHNERLLQRHTVIVRFLTMLVGAGGNAGNQASVRVIRGLATGQVDDANIKPYLKRELQAGFFLSVVLGVAGCLRAAVFLTPLAETFAITTSLIMIVASSIFLGTVLPLLMKIVKIDPAHSSTTIQVLMDILGVAITVYISSIVLDQAVGGDLAEN